MAQGEGEQGKGRGAGDTAERAGVDSAWISHVSMEQGTLMSTYLRWVQRTSKATTPLPTLAERSPPSPLFYPLDPPPTYATLLPPCSHHPALPPTSIPPNPLTTLPVDPIYVRSRVRSLARSLVYTPPYVPHVPRLHTSGT